MEKRRFNNTYFIIIKKNVLLNASNGDILILERGEKYGTVSKRTISFKDKRVLP